MESIKKLLSILRCPSCNQGGLFLESSNKNLTCKKCDSLYPITNNHPVMLRVDNAVFKASDYSHAEKGKVGLKSRIAKLIPDPSINLSRKKILMQMGERLSSKKPTKILVLGSGNQRKLLGEMINNNQVQLICIDIDVNADVDIFCDGHDLPFVDESFDAVITTVVLEHVMYPERVAAEIHRVLKLGGLLYSELPFMQQVHEGAYDFTRYSLSGHRRLFNRFSEISGGMVAGPATALIWTVENFILIFFTMPSVRLPIKAIIRLTLFWFKYFDVLLEKLPAAMDAASCTYFFGAKINGQVGDDEIISRYVGAKHVNHV